MQKKINEIEIHNRNSLNNQIITALPRFICCHQIDDERMINYECPKVFTF